MITGYITPNRERTILYVAPDWKPIVLSAGIRTIHGAVIDVDGNGKPDFVGARYHPGLVYWLERPADPFREPFSESAARALKRFPEFFCVVFVTIPQLRGSAVREVSQRHDKPDKWICGRWGVYGDRSASIATF